eukprot:TRINITY_DN13713_c0_g2_i1.p1 TRINITY_DN13713_c0_g2~~TRINITY_DN13713_c0_g2_i1.p1  ORF type:complete len:709 (-),score=155.74 TRINITY_DN13713_c0_g2_i1:348-2474(-)
MAAEIGDTRLVKQMASYLRHKGLKSMRDDGFALVDDVASVCHVDVEDVLEVAELPGKQRFQIFDDRGQRWIRATYGHSLKKVSLASGSLYRELRKPLDILVQAVTSDMIPLILAKGLQRNGRPHLLFVGSDNGSALQTAFQESATSLVYIDMAEAMRAGIIFHSTPDGLIVSEGLSSGKGRKTSKVGTIPPEFIKKIAKRFSPQEQEPARTSASGSAESAEAKAGGTSGSRAKLKNKKLADTIASEGDHLAEALPTSWAELHAQPLSQAQRDFLQTIQSRQASSREGRDSQQPVHQQKQDLSAARGVQNQRLQTPQQHQDKTQFEAISQQQQYNQQHDFNQQYHQQHNQHHHQVEPPQSQRLLQQVQTPQMQIQQPLQEFQASRPQQAPEQVLKQLAEHQAKLHELAQQVGQLPLQDRAQHLPFLAQTLQHQQSSLQDVVQQHLEQVKQQQQQQQGAQQGVPPINVELLQNMHTQNVITGTMLQRLQETQAHGVQNMQNMHSMQNVHNASLQSSMASKAFMMQNVQSSLQGAPDFQQSQQMQPAQCLPMQAQQATQFNAGHPSIPSMPPTQEQQAMQFNRGYSSMLEQQGMHFNGAHPGQGTSMQFNGVHAQHAACGYGQKPLGNWQEPMPPAGQESQQAPGHWGQGQAPRIQMQASQRQAHHGMGLLTAIRQEPDVDTQALNLLTSMCQDDDTVKARGLLESMMYRR